MLDRTGPNVMSGPIPRDGFTTDAYEQVTRDKIHELGYSDILGETGARPDELANGTGHLAKLEHMRKSAKDLSFTEGFTGNFFVGSGDAGAMWAGALIWMGSRIPARRASLLLGT